MRNKSGYVGVPECRGWKVWLWVQLTAILGMSLFVDWKLMSRVRDGQDHGDARWAK